MRLPRLPFPPSPPALWAVEDSAAQITWGSLPLGPVTVRVTEDGGSPLLTEQSVDHGGGPGSMVITDLPADTALRFQLIATNGSTELTGRTLAPPPGALVARFATISDLHLGSDHFGFFKQMVEREDHPEPFAFRSASAAIDEAVEWGAESIVIKGDAAHHGNHHHFAEVGRLVDRFAHVPMRLVPGNHDVDLKRDPLPEAVGRRGVRYVRDVEHLDLPSLRLVFGDTTIETRGKGTLREVSDRLVETAGAADGAAMIVIHQQLQEHNQVRYWPPGIRGDEARSFLQALHSANPNSLVTSGHTHRNRMRRHGSIVITEVAATHHWPAVWAGYAVHEGGVRQVVRRISSNDTMRWHEYSKNAVLGVWGWYAPGRIAQRCFSHRWG